MIKVQIHFLKPICSIALPVCQEPRTMNLCRISARIGTRLFLFIWNSSNAVPGIVLYAYPGAAKNVKAGGAKLLRCYKWNVRKQGTWSSLRTCTSHIKLLVAAASMKLTSVWTGIMLLHHCHNMFIFFNHQGLQLSTCKFQSFWKFWATNLPVLDWCFFIKLKIILIYP